MGKNRNRGRRLLDSGMERREVDVNRLRMQMVRLGIMEDLSKLTDIVNMMDRFVLTGESIVGSVSLEGFGVPRVMEYSFIDGKYPVVNLRSIN